MKQTFLLIFIAISGIASSQPYKSIFGSASTMWIIKWYNLDFGGIDTIVVEKDTVAYGFNWKKITTTHPSGFRLVALLREDTLIGKVWYHPFDTGDDSTYLAFDFSLLTKDSFDLSSNYDPFLIDVKVDSAYNTATGKKIVFDALIENTENITFIEGVGGNQGPTYKQSNGLLNPYLLCAYKDGIQTYSNISYNGNCDTPTGIDEADVVSEIVVYPNPFNDVLYIKNLLDNIVKKVDVFDAIGRTIYSDHSQSEINFHDLPNGPYYVRLITNKGRILTKAVIHQ